jgi:hypothetical protein
MFFRTNPPMRGAFQMLDGEEKLYSLRKPFIVHFISIYVKKNTMGTEEN